MKKTYKQKREQGFTIIEVLIVLAIAALIFLIVFLAVPALQRNSRNNAIRHDAGNILSGISTYESNNNGVLPGGVNCASGNATIDDGSGNNKVTVGVQGTTICKLIASSATPTWPGLSEVDIDPGYTCNGNGIGGANPRAVAALFKVETGSTDQQQCLSS